MGINFKDLLYAENAKIYNGRLYFKRAKTGIDHSVKITPIAKKIIEKYKGEELMLNILENKLLFAKENRTTQIHTDVTRTVNDHLKDICTKLKINLDVSTYFARHTWATIARKIGIDYDIIQLALGHSNNDVTAGYIEYNFDLIDAANVAVIDFVIKNRMHKKT
jgi:integrase